MVKLTTNICRILHQVYEEEIGRTQVLGWFKLFVFAGYIIG